jgi:DNA-binding NarL/FixJ family response regulator
MVRLGPGTAGHDTLLEQKDCVNAKPARELFSETTWAHLKRALGLTARQCEVARLICSGFGYEAVALHTGISINTVRMHMRALFAKLGVHDRVSAILLLISVERDQSSATRWTQDEM